MADRLCEIHPQQSASTDLCLLGLMREGCDARSAKPDAAEQAKTAFLSGIPEHERAKLGKHCLKFDQCCCDPIERQRFYKELTRLLEAPASAVEFRDRVQITEQIVRHAASPATVHQGHHNTCSAATAEQLLYRYEPASAAAFVSDLVVNGKYEWNSIRSVMPGSIFHKDAESRSSSDRDFASQIFQLGMLNVYWANQNTGPFKIWHGQGAVTFEETDKIKSAADTGERLLLHNGSATTELSTNPEVAAGSVQFMYMFAVKDFPDNFVIENKRESSGLSVEVSNVAELKSIIADRKAHNRPLVIKIHAGNEPFLSQMLGYNSLSLDSVWHVVSIDDFDAHAGMVKIHDTARHEEPDQWIGLNTLYQATLAPASESWKNVLREKHR